MHVVPLAHEYPGASRGENLSRCSERLMRKIGSRRFVLTVGTVEIRKNHRLLLKVWEDISRVSAEVPLLVVAGAAGWLAQSVIKSLREADSTAPYMFIETPTDEELKWLYNRCLFTVFVSTVEGWGLPVGESLWFNKPCVALRTTSVPEVGGELCDYPSSDMPQEIAQTIGHLLYDANYRTERIQRISKAKLRTWNEVSNEIASYIGSLR
jgi:glycosyltransferase involved in cell wall biosynthesis